MKLIVQMRGLDAATLRTKKLIEAARSGLKLSVPDAAQVMVQAAKEIVPVDTGRLQNAIHQEPYINEPETQVVLVAPCVEADNDWGIDPPYARRIEFGFVGADRLGRVYNQAPRPYMRPAFDQTKDEMRSLIKEGVYDQMDAAMVSR